MAEPDKLDALIATVDAIHRTVVRIETDHGDKLKLLFEAQDAIITRLDRLEGRQDKLEAGQARLEAAVEALQKDTREIKTTVGLLHTIANDQETRPRRLEAIVEDLRAA